MSLRATILTGLAILGIGLFGVWQFAPSVFSEARDLLEPERLEMLVVRTGLWGPVMIVTLMTLAVAASPIPSASIALAAGASLRACLGNGAGRDRRRTWGADRLRSRTVAGA